MCHCICVLGEEKQNAKVRLLWISPFPYVFHVFNWESQVDQGPDKEDLNCKRMHHMILKMVKGSKGVTREECRPEKSGNGVGVIAQNVCMYSYTYVCAKWILVWNPAGLKTGHFLWYSWEQRHMYSQPIVIYTSLRRFDMVGVIPRFCVSWWLRVSSSITFENTSLIVF